MDVETVYTITGFAPDMIEFEAFCHNKLADDKYEWKHRDFGGKTELYHNKPNLLSLHSEFIARHGDSIFKQLVKNKIRFINHE